MMIDAKFPLIVLETHDENQAKELLTRVAIKKTRPIKYWSISAGLSQAGFGLSLAEKGHAQDPKTILQSILSDQDPSLFVLCDYHPYLDNHPVHIRLLKDIALRYEQLGHTVVLLSYAINIPPELQRLMTKFTISFPSKAELIGIIREEIKAFQAQKPGVFIAPKIDVIHKMISSLRGLGSTAVRRLIRSAIFQDGALTESDLPEINKAKFALLDMSGVISFEYDTEKFSDVGGLKNLKNWVLDRKHAFLENNHHDRPKGIMLLGVQGGGKSLAAKAVAGLWSLPLLRLDMASLYNKYIGETENNLRKALQQAEMMSPCVLWIDEIEKGINTQGDNDIASRVLGTLLTWMSEHKKSVFIVATANDISALPPELIRKGRLDEIFFVDLPSSAVRQQIFRIHLQKRNLNLADFDLPALGESTEGFVGAEIEQTIVSAIYTAKAQQRQLNTELLIDEIAKTYLLSVVMAEKITALRHWAQDRTLSAG